LSSLTFLTPVFALLFGNLLLGEILSPLQWVGVSLTLISIYLINQREVLKIGGKISAVTEELETNTVPVSLSIQDSKSDLLH